jgi:hypothetical protein
LVLVERLEWFDVTYPDNPVGDCRTSVVHIETGCVPSHWGWEEHGLVKIIDFPTAGALCFVVATLASG